MVYVSVLVRRFGASVRNMSSARKKVFVARNDMPERGITILKEKCDLTFWNQASPVPREEFMKSVKGVDGIFCSLTDKIDKDLLESAGPSLKVIGTISVGYDHIDLAECKKRGIRVGYTPEVLTDAVAELTVALLLSTARRLPEAQAEVRSGGWGKLGSWAPVWLTGHGLAGSTVGIVGYGRIGHAVAKIIKSFNTKQILYYNRSENPNANEVGAKKVSFDELLAESDFVISCISFSPETKEMFNKAAFEKMKSSAIFVNTSRGAVVDQTALIEALKNNVIYAAGLDVTVPEPLPIDNELLKLDNCVVLPHIGSATIDTRNTMSELTAYNILAAFEGKDMPAELKV